MEVGDVISPAPTRHLADSLPTAVGEGAVRRRPPRPDKTSSPARNRNRRSYNGSPSTGVKRLVRSTSNSPAAGNGGRYGEQYGFKLFL